VLSRVILHSVVEIGVLISAFIAIHRGYGAHYLYLLLWSTLILYLFLNLHLRHGDLDYATSWVHSLYDER
jgi:hypothetical protein